MLRSFNPQIEIILLLPFSYEYLLLLFIAQLPSLTRTSTTMLNRNGKSKHLYIVSNLRRKTFSPSPLSIMLAVSFFQMVFIRLKDNLFHSYFVDFCFIMKVYWILSNYFSVQVIMWCVTLIDCHVLNLCCILEINPTWLSFTIVFTCCWVLFADILLKIFVSIFLRHVVLQFLFRILVMFFSGFRIRVILFSQNEVEIGSSSSNFWKCLLNVGVKYSLSIWQNSLVKSVGPGLSFVGSFLFLF